MNKVYVKIISKMIFLISIYFTYISKKYIYIKSMNVNSIQNEMT